MKEQRIELTWRPTWQASVIIFIGAHLSIPGKQVFAIVACKWAVAAASVRYT